MKKGKTVKINQYQSLKTSYGTVDSKNLKSLYLNIQSWVQPKDEYENWDRIVANLSREVKHSVLESLNTNYYKTNFIVDLDLRTSGIQINKKSFMNLEVNLFLNNEMDFKSNEIKDSIRMIIRQIYKDCVLKNKYFLFYPTKNSEVEEVMD
jgi:hypothetical protein